MKHLVPTALLVALGACGEVQKLAEDAGPRPDAAPPDAKLVDAPPASIDAPPAAPTFAVVFISGADIRQTSGVSAPQIGLVINIGTDPLPIDQMQVTSSTDDDPGAVFQLEIANPSPSGTVVAPNEVHGLTSGATVNSFLEPLLAGGETRTNLQRPTIDWILNNIAATANADVNATGVLRIGDQIAELKFVFKVFSTGPSGATFTGATRVESHPL